MPAKSKVEVWFLSRPVTHPKFNNEFAPEKWWLNNEPFLLGRVTFQGPNCWTSGGYPIPKSPDKNNETSQWQFKISRDSLGAVCEPIHPRNPTTSTPADLETSRPGTLGRAAEVRTSEDFDVWRFMTFHYSGVTINYPTGGIKHCNSMVIFEGFPF